MTQTEIVNEAANKAKAMCDNLPSDAVNPSTFIALFEQFVAAMRADDAQMPLAVQREPPESDAVS